MPVEEHCTLQHALTLDSDLAELKRLEEFIDEFCDRAALTEQDRYHVSLVLEELVVNSVEHGGCEPRSGAILINVRRDRDRLSIEYSDTGVPFDPLAAPAPDLAENVGSRPVGGLGIHLVRCLMPEIRYERHGGRNHLYLTRPIDDQAKQYRR